tara:strand:+ start:34713 stop:35060 length:348 start_codon:yes stop_codon:yes gene_type:complete
MKGPTNYQLQELISQLAKARESGLWNSVSNSLMKPSRQRCSVNVYKIEKFAREGETIIVPGKVLSVGELNKKVDVAAFQFSEGAREKILGAQGKVLTIAELFKSNPDGKKVRILK